MVLPAKACVLHGAYVSLTCPYEPDMHLRYSLTGIIKLQTLPNKKASPTDSPQTCPMNSFVCVLSARPHKSTGVKEHLPMNLRHIVLDHSHKVSVYGGQDPQFLPAAGAYRWLYTIPRRARAAAGERGRLDGRGAARGPL